MPPKVLILFGHVLAVAATILLAFGDGENTYWRLVFPGLIIGSAGAMLIYMHVRYVTPCFEDDLRLISVVL